MNGHLDIQPWSRQRWTWGFLLVLGLHLALFWVAQSTNPQKWTMRREAPVFRVRPMGHTFIDFHEGSFSSLNDPVLFALPSHQGFSGRAWMRIPGIDYSMEEWSESPRWLNPPLNSLTVGLSDFVLTNETRGFSISEKPGPPPSPGMKKKVFVLGESRFFIEGDLAQRPLLSKPVLKAVEHTDVLKPTVVELAVTPAGEVFSAAVLQSSGSDQVDRQALEAAGTLVFEGSSRPDVQLQDAQSLIWGRMVVKWVTGAPKPK